MIFVCTIFSCGFCMYHFLICGFVRTIFSYVVLYVPFSHMWFCTYHFLMWFLYVPFSHMWFLYVPFSHMWFLYVPFSHMWFLYVPFFCNRICMCAFLLSIYSCLVYNIHNSILNCEHVCTSSHFTPITVCYFFLWPIISSIIVMFRFFSNKTLLNSESFIFFSSQLLF